VELSELINNVVDELVAIDSSRTPFKQFQPGVGPYGEPQLVRELAQRLSVRPGYVGRVVTKRTPDLLIQGDWAIEFKIARPFGDNGKLAENWSVNLLSISRKRQPYRRLPQVAQSVSQRKKGGSSNRLRAFATASSPTTPNSLI
jgi:hypothetical protein